MENGIDTEHHHLERGVFTDVDDGEDEGVGHNWGVGRGGGRDISHDSESDFLVMHIDHKLKNTCHPQLDFLISIYYNRPFRANALERLRESFKLFCCALSIRPLSIL